MEQIVRMWKSFWLLFTNNKVSVLVGDPLFRYWSLDEWREDKGGMFELLDVSEYEVLCLDTSGRVCSLGKHFHRAEAEDCYPITAYEVL